MRASAVKLIATAIVCVGSAVAQVSDVGCFVNGVCGSGSIVGGNDRLADEKGSIQQNCAQENGGYAQD